MGAIGVQYQYKGGCNRSDDMITIEEIMLQFPDEEFLVADGLGDAIMGIDVSKMVLVYSVERILEIFIERDEMTPDGALEFFELKVAGAYMGDKTPIWFEDLSQ